MNNLYNWGVERIKADSMWSEIESKQPVIVAVLDNGFNICHPDLIGRIYTNINDPIDGIDNDGNKIIDDYQGYDFGGKDSDLSGNYHGTSCLGVVLSANPYCQLLPLKTAGQQGFLSTHQVEAMNYCCKLKEQGVNIRVISCSFVGIANLEVCKAIIKCGELGILVVGGAGNDGVDVGNQWVEKYPAEFPSLDWNWFPNLTIDNVLGVGSSNSADQKSGFSNFGDNIDVFAPGEGLKTINSSGSGYSGFSGTSAATPLVSGAASLLFQYNPNFRAEDVRQILIDSVDKLNLPCYSEGRINLQKAFELAKNWDISSRPITPDFSFQVAKNQELKAKLTNTESGNYFPSTEKPTRGVLTLAKTGDFIYTSPKDYLGIDNYYYRFSNGTGKFNQGKITIDIVEFIPEPEISYIDLSQIQTYAHKRDKGIASIENNELSLSNKSWKKLQYNVNISNETVLKFEFKTTQKGTLQGIGFDTNAGYHEINWITWFNLGTHSSQGLQDFKYQTIGEWESFTIPVGQFFQGAFNFIIFIQDDRKESETLSYFRNIYLDTSITPIACRFKC